MKLPFIRARSLQIPSPCRCPVGGVQAAARDYPTTHALTHIHRPRRRSAVVRTRKRHCRSPRGCLLASAPRPLPRFILRRFFAPLVASGGRALLARYRSRVFPRSAREPLSFICLGDVHQLKNAHSVARSSGIHRELLIFFCLTYHIFIPRIVIAGIISFR